MSNSFRRLLGKIGVRLIASKVLRLLDYDLVVYRKTPVANQIKLLKHYGIDLVLDVGANAGQFAMEIRNYGYRGEIVSFEPISFVYAQLKKNAKKDRFWDTVHLGLGDRDERKKINISRDILSSSILSFESDALSIVPNTDYIGTEDINVVALDSIFNDYYHLDRKVFLKIDTQGYEKKVLDGAILSLEKIIGVRLEMSLLPLYKGEVLFWEMAEFLKSKGFTLCFIEPGHCDPISGRLIQADGVFYRL